MNTQPRTARVSWTFWGRVLVSVAIACVVVACGGDDEPAQPASDESSEEAATQPAPAAPSEAAVPAEVPAVNLLQTVQSRVTTSSANNEDPRQTWRLTDGDLHTAWNSAPMDASDEPERIVIRLPDQVTVTTIALTAGYTNVRGETDLFTENRRVQAVRIHHGDDHFDARLDIADRTLQHVDVHGDGGEWIIELTEWVDGSGPYREIVVSEIQVLGAPGSGAPPYEASPEPPAPAEFMLTSKSAIRRALVAASTSLETLRSLMDLESTGFMFSLNDAHGLADSVSCTDEHFEHDLILPADFDQDEHWSPVLPASISATGFSCRPDLSRCSTDREENQQQYVFEFRVNDGGRRHLSAIVPSPSSMYLEEDYSVFRSFPTCSSR